MSRRLTGETHLRVYLDLIERHPETFARYLPELWSRRQRDLGHVLREARALEVEWDAWLSVRLADRHSEAAALRSRPDPAAAERISWEATVAAREHELRARDRELATARDRIGQLAGEVSALRSSLSWRLTRPLRAVVGMLRGE
jgi:hypothetical protein